jgi:hypothetical protein
MLALGSPAGPALPGASRAFMPGGDVRTRVAANGSANVTANFAVRCSR